MNSVAAIGAGQYTISSRLRRIVWMMLIPTTVISLIAGFLVYRAERDAVVEAAAETARALSLVTDRELAVRSALLRSLALSPTLERGDLEAFQQEAIRLVPNPHHVIAYTDTSGRQLMNTRVRWGQALPQDAIFALPAEPPQQSLLVSDLYRAPIGGAFSFAVGVPVYAHGQLKGYLGMGSAASQLQRIFHQQPLPKQWLGVVVDRKGYVLARNLDPEKRVGMRASDHVRAAMSAANSGMVSSKTLDGVEVFTVFNRAPESGWTVLIGLDREQLRGAALRAFFTVMVMSLVFIAVALWAAGRASRSVVKLLEQLQSDAQTLGQGGLVREARSGVVEIDTVQRSLVLASEHRASADDHLRDEVERAVRTAEQVGQAAQRGQKLEALGQLTGGIAHDFNNLLQTMTTGLQLAQRLASDPRAERALAACGRAAARATKLTQQLMTFGRQQGGRDEIVEMEAGLRSLFELIRGAISESIAMVLDVRGPLWPTKLDPVQLELAVLNLAFNARDAMEGRGELTLLAENRSIGHGDVAGLAAGDYVTLLISDTGSGMTPAVVERAFEPFFTTKAVGKGSGIGLAQVYGFAKKAGGLATIASVVSKGTTVTLWLPRSASAAPSSAGSMAPMTYDATVLIVEDDATVLEMVSAALFGLGFKTLAAIDCEQALHIIQERSDIDVVLSDVMMPGEMSGIDLAATLKVLRPALPVILASGYAENFDQASSVDFIAKPYDVNVLARKIAELLGKNNQAPA